MCSTSKALDEELRAIENQQLASKLDSDSSSASAKLRKIIEDLTEQIKLKVSFLPRIAKKTVAVYVTYFELL